MSKNISNKEKLEDVNYQDWDLSLVKSLRDDSVSNPSSSSSSSDWDLSLVTSLSDDSVSTPTSSDWDLGEEK